MARPLTDKQTKFVDNYLKTLNATQSAIDAGYSEKTANRIGPQNLSKVGIKDAIEKAQKESAERSNITVDKITEMHTKAFKVAEEKEIPSAMTASAKNLAELHGFLVHKTKDVSEKPIEITVKRLNGNKDNAATG